jgi:1,4-alpha-glucan branching enzyme
MRTAATIESEHGCITKSVTRIITDYEAYLFGEGHWLQAWEKMGARPAVVDGRAGYSFVVWAPNARAVSVVGDFNQWDGRGHMMRSLGASGLWEAFVPGLDPGTNYKFEIHPEIGAPFTKCDPYGLRMERPPNTASVTSHLGEYEWRDAAWIADRQERGTVLDGPMSVYEVHPGSWRRNPFAVLARTGRRAGAVPD